jgi:hypothetical protein
VNREECQRLAEDRVLDADALIAAGRWSAAYYLLGYALECALKSCILALVTRTGVIFENKKFIEECWTHEPTKLLKSAGLDQELGLAIQANIRLAENWQIAKDWTEIARYRQTDRVAAERIYQAIADPVDGVLPWLKARW